MSPMGFLVGKGLKTWKWGRLAIVDEELLHLNSA